MSPVISAELRRELSEPPLWMYPWAIGGAEAPIHSEELPGIHEARLAMMEPAVREVLDAAESPTVIDLACNEGWFSHRLLEWGAERVVGIDIREVNVRRARLIAEHLEIGEDRLEFRTGDVYELGSGSYGRFDVVLLLGLIYHVEDPVRAVRIAHSLCDRLCVIESQLTRQAAPVAWGRGPGHTELAPASFAAYPEPDAEVNPVASDSRSAEPDPERRGGPGDGPRGRLRRGRARRAGADRPLVLPHRRPRAVLCLDRGAPGGAAPPMPEARARPAARPSRCASPGSTAMRRSHSRAACARASGSPRSSRRSSPPTPPWMYPWRFGSQTAPIHHDMLASVHRTRAEMIEAPVREALAAADRPRAIDLACNEGWFSHRLLEWGAASVLGVDIREVNVRRARLVARELGLDGPRARVPPV